MRELKQIQESLINDAPSPGELADLRLELSGQYSYYSGVLESILITKPKIWMDLRKDNKSDTATERAWEATEDGIKEMRCRLRMKRIEKMLSAIRQRLEVMQGEARNVF